MRIESRDKHKYLIYWNIFYVILFNGYVKMCKELYINEKDLILVLDKEIAIIKQSEELIKSLNAELIFYYKSLEEEEKKIVTDSGRQQQSKFRFIEVLKNKITDLNHKKESILKQTLNYEHKIIRKEELLSKLNLIPTSLQFINAELSSLRALKYKLKDSVVVGDELLENLEKALKKFESADRWGNFDILGGGFITGLVKHGSYNQGCTYVAQAKKLLDCFNQHLNEVNISITKKVHQFSSAEFYSDIFISGYFINTLIQEKIEDTYRQVAKIKKESQRVLEQLKCQNVEITNIEKNIIARKNLIIERVMVE